MSLRTCSRCCSERELPIRFHSTLTQADIGIAMGTGTDVAMESVGVTLVKGDLTGIVRAHKLSQSTIRNIRQNLFCFWLQRSWSSNWSTSLSVFWNFIKSYACKPCDEFERLYVYLPNKSLELLPFNKLNWFKWLQGVRE